MHEKEGTEEAGRRKMEPQREEQAKGDAHIPTHRDTNDWQPSAAPREVGEHRSRRIRRVGLTRSDAHLDPALNLDIDIYPSLVLHIDHVASAASDDEGAGKGNNS